MGVIEGIMLPFKIIWLWLCSIAKALLPRKRKDISGEIVFITGAGSGIGRLIAYRFAKYGATVICTDLNKDSADETASVISGDNGKAYSYQLDVTNRADVYKLATLLRKEVGDVNILVNNAGIVTGKSFLECPDDLMVKTMDVNTISHFWTLKAFLGPMIERNHGHVVAIASLAGYFGTPKLLDYTASKFGVVGMMESLAMELWDEARDVQTTTVCPYFIKTGMFKGIQSRNVLLPLLEPDYVADEIVHGILNNETTIMIPRFMIMVLMIMKSALPMSIGHHLGDLLETGKVMDTFVGRKERID